VQLPGGTGFSWKNGAMDYSSEKRQIVAAGKRRGIFVGFIL
jgi:hypothetical protein